MKLFQINLLPEYAKRETRYVLLARVIYRFTAVIFFLILIWSATLLPAYFRLSLQKEAVLAELAAEEQNPANKRAVDLNRTVTSVNKEIQALRAALVGERPAGQALLALFAAAPAGVHISHLEFNRQNQSLSFGGKADNRADILALESSLKASPAVAAVTSPLSNIIKETNIDFTMQVTIKL